jgi:hypothetical protein
MIQRIMRRSTDTSRSKVDQLTRHTRFRFEVSYEWWGTEVSPQPHTGSWPPQFDGPDPEGRESATPFPCCKILTAKCHLFMLLCLHVPMCRMLHTERDDMPTNLAIDDRLLEEAQKVGGHRTKRETVTAALQEYIKRRKQQEILALFGTIDYESGYDYKRERKAKRV